MQINSADILSSAAILVSIATLLFVKRQEKRTLKHLAANRKTDLLARLSSARLLLDNYNIEVTRLEDLIENWPEFKFSETRLFISKNFKSISDFKTQIDNIHNKISEYEYSETIKSLEFKIVQADKMSHLIKGLISRIDYIRAKNETLRKQHEEIFRDRPR